MWYAMTILQWVHIGAMTQLSKKQTEQRASLGFQGDWHSDIPIRIDRFDKINCPVQPLSILFPPKLQACCQAAFNAFIAAGLCTKATLQVDDAPSWVCLCAFLQASISGSTNFEMQTSCWRCLWTFGQAEEALSWCCRSWSKASKNLFHAFLPDCMSLQNRKVCSLRPAFRSVQSLHSVMMFDTFNDTRKTFAYLCHASDFQDVRIAPVTSGCRRPFGWCPAATVGGNGTNLDFEWFQNRFPDHSSLNRQQPGIPHTAHWWSSRVRRLYSCLRKRWPQFCRIQSKLPWSRGWRRTVMWNNLDIFGSKSEDVQTQTCPKLI